MSTEKEYSLANIEAIGVVAITIGLLALKRSSQAGLVVLNQQKPR